MQLIAWVGETGKLEEKTSWWWSFKLMKIKLFSIIFFLFLTLSVPLTTEIKCEQSSTESENIFVFIVTILRLDPNLGISHFLSHLTKSKQTGVCGMWQAYEWRLVSLISLCGWWYLGLLRGLNLNMLDPSQGQGTEPHSVVDAAKMKKRKGRCCQNYSMSTIKGKTS